MVESDVSRITNYNLEDGLILYIPRGWTLDVELVPWFRGN